IRLCLARVVTPRLTRAMSRPPYFRPYGAQAFTRAVSASASTSVPRFWRIYLALWLISRWRLPATPCLILPVAVSLKRFLTPLLVFSLGIFVSLPLGADAFERPRQPLWPGRSVSSKGGKKRRLYGAASEKAMLERSRSGVARPGRAAARQTAASLLRGLSRRSSRCRSPPTRAGHPAHWRAWSCSPGHNK